MNTTNGKIAERSKQKFIDALLSVMKIDKFKDITVTQIAQEACLSRKTFYSLFSDKTQVIQLYFEKLSEEFIACIQKAKASDYWGIIKCYFDFFAERKDLIYLLYDNNLIHYLFEISYKHASTIFYSVHKTGDIPETHLPLILAYSLSGINGMLLKWIEHGMSVPVDELITILKNSFNGL